MEENKILNEATQETPAAEVDTTATVENFQQEQEQPDKSIGSKVAAAQEGITKLEQELKDAKQQLTAAKREKGLIQKLLDYKYEGIYEGTETDLKKALTTIMNLIDVQDIPCIEKDIAAINNDLKVLKGKLKKLEKIEKDLSEI